MATMRRYEARLERLEAGYRPPKNHCVLIVSVPWSLDETDQARWLREDVTCACGRQGCPALRISLLVPERAPSDEAWAERAAQYREENRYG
jgi:hypothetical protein